MNLNILVVEDNIADFMLVARRLARDGVDASCHRIGSAQELVATLDECRWDAALLGCNLPGMAFEQTLAAVRAQCPNLPAIVVAGTVGEERAVELLKGGVADLVRKDDLRRLAHAVTRAVAEANTRRERAEALAALRESEANVRQILEHAREGIALIDRHARVVVANGAVAEMLEVEVADMLGKPVVELLKDQPDQRIILEAIDRLHSERMVTVEGRLRRANGEWWWVRTSAAAVRDERGEWNGAMAIITDMTAERKAQNELLLQTAALNASADAVVITAPDGKVLWTNPAFTELTGYTRSEAVGRNPRELVRSGAHTPEFYKTLWNTISSGRVWRGEITNRRKDGTLYREDMSITPVRDSAGQIVSFIAIKRDLTEKLRLEAQFQQAQKMESVGRLAGGVAHDFNNLLTVINGFTEFSLEGLAADDPRRNDLLEIQRAGQRAATLTRQLLAFSRKQIVNLQDTDLNAIIDGTRKMLQRVIGEDIKLFVNIDGPPQFIRADAGQLEQVVMNLVVNARDAMPEGGTLTIATRAVTLENETATITGLLLPGAYVALEITDTGVGMTPEVQTSMFEPFFTTKDRDRGTGLGLSTVHGIVAQIGGGIEVRSAPGKGTTFTLSFPRVATDAPARPTAEDDRVAAGSGTILIVEDDEVVRATAERMLTSAGYDIIAVDNGAQAILAMVHDGRPLELLLTDAVMPGISGLQLIDWVGRHRPQMKTLLMSGHTENAKLLRSVDEQGQRCVTKPFTTASLSRMVRETLNGTASSGAGRG